MRLPNGKSLSVKVCQDNSKALMSNPNKDLGKWLLRDVLQLKDGELLTIELLDRLGFDSVRVTKEINKLGETSYSIDICKDVNGDL